MSHKNLKMSRTQNVPLIEKKAVWFENSDFVAVELIQPQIYERKVLQRTKKYLKPNDHPKDLKVVSQVRVATRRPSLPFLRKKEKEKKEEMSLETACRPLDNLDMCFWTSMKWNSLHILVYSCCLRIILVLTHEYGFSILVKNIYHFSSLTCWFSFYHFKVLMIIRMIRYWNEMFSFASLC